MTPHPKSDQSPQVLIEQALQKASEYLLKDKVKEAEEQYQAVLKIQADHPEANYHLGLLALRKNQSSDSLPYFETALDQRPDHGPYWLAYIEALDKAGQSDVAREVLKIAQQSGLEGEEADALAARLGIMQESPTEHAAPAQEDIDNLVSLYQQGRTIDCEKLARSILARFPNHGFSWKVLGAVLNQQERLDEAISAMKQAVLLQPEDPEALNNLGLTLEKKGLLSESESTLRRALNLNGNFAEAHNSLGVTLMAQGRLTESEECFRKALHIQPDYAEAYCNLGINLKEQGRFIDSEINLQHALKFRPSYAEAYNNLGNVLHGQGRLSEAEAYLRKALELKPDFAIAYNNLGNTLHGQGHLEESIHCHLKALELKPDYAEAYEGLLFVSNYHPDKSGHELFQLYREYDERFGLPHRHQWAPHNNNRNADRRLKVGYVSPAFYSHPVSHFLEPLLAHHDKTRFEVYAYAEIAREDAKTLCYKQHVHHWLPTVGLSDDELAERIRSDGIDILVDLAGHTGRNRLGVFARKPAPVSLHWLDFGYTTGLSAIDYYLSDLNSAPIGSENLFSEQLWRLPAPAFAYRPKTDMGNVSPLPAAQRGYITFGTLTRAIRINYRTIRVWSEILSRIPNSRLVIDSGNFKDPTIQKVLIDKFAAQGIDKNRLDIGYHSPPWDVLRNIDIGLDCFPHNSGTTLFESLYLGIPFITLADRPSVGRLGCSILEGISHPEWISRNEEDYIEKAISLASDLPALASIRTSLREEMQKSPLMDEQGFVRRAEDAYRSMFKIWCENAPPAPDQTAVPPTINDKPPRIAADSIASYNFAIDLQQQGRLVEAKNQYIKAINIQHDLVEAYNNLGAIFQKEGKYSDAEACFIKSIEIKPDYAEAYYNLANTCKLQQQIGKAEANYRKVIEIQPDYTNAHYNLGNILQEQGRPQEAEICLRHALKLDPNHTKAFSTLLFTLNYHPDKSSEEIFKAYQEFNARFCLPLQDTWLPYTNTRQKNRQLKIGYMAPDYRKHPARYFLEPLLAHHDKRSFETYAYVELSNEDAATDLFHKYVDHWKPTAGLTDDQISECIRNDGIDILVDLAGHTAGNRLGVFARKPAPVALHWLDFGYTTGLTAIDYYLTDHATVPPGTEHYFSESPWRLETPALAYRPPMEMGPVNVLPAQKNGYITFGTLTRAVRINHRTIRVWSEILKRCEGSRLIINSGSFKEPAMQEALAGRFIPHGVEPERLDIGCHSPPWDVLRNIDIGLDCFPHNSGTTLVESLYMGVPYITLADRPSVGRLGCSILEGIGHPEWIAQTEEEYVELAVALATDPQKLATLRAALRQEIENSHLMDETGFTRKVENAYKEMFAKWCQTEPSVLTQRVGSGVTAASLQTISYDARKTHKQKNTKSRKKVKSAQSRKTKQTITKPHPDETSRLVFLFQQEKYTEGELLARSLVERFPEKGFFWKALGTFLHQQGKLNEALSVIKQALVFLQNDAESHNILASILDEKGRRGEAESEFRKALELNPNYVEVYFNLGNTLQKQGRYIESEFNYRKALELRENYAEVHCNLGNSLVNQGKLNEAENCFRRAIELKPNYAEAYNNLGNSLEKQGRYIESEISFQKMLQLTPDSSEGYNNLGNVLRSQGRLCESELSYRQALKLQPDHTVVHSNLLFLLNNLPDKSPEDIYQEYKSFNTQFGLPLQNEWKPFTNSPETNRRLKVGYVSPQFRKHSTRHFLEPLLAHHDKKKVEVYAYTDLLNEDEITDRYKSYVDHWVKSEYLSDTALADRIRADGIDILVDLSGHTGGNRLKVFARKPAPVSLHWLDFGYTTGLTAIDYYLTDYATVPAGSDNLFSETPWRIETPCLAYRPAEGMGKITPLPAQERGYVTFGTLTRALRINHRTIRVWSEILKKVEGSHLVIDSNNFKETAIQEELANKFVAHGIDRERLQIGCHSPPWDVLRGLDIGLDCFPHNSGTTLIETLYMGSPFITLADRPCTGRLGSAILEGLGHPEWIAYTEDEYVELAVALASDLPKLANLRSALRQEMQKSPLMDEAGFTRKVETAYREMFHKWVSQRNIHMQRPNEETEQAQLIDRALQQAISCHQSGFFKEAEELYQSILNIEPKNPEANFNLGLLAVSLNHPSAALPFFETALNACPEHGPYWLAYIDALDKAGQTESANHILEMAIQSGLAGEEVEALKTRLSGKALVPSAGKSVVAAATAKRRAPQQHGRTQSATEPHPDEIHELVSLFQQEKYMEGERRARLMAERFPQNGFGWKALGALLKIQGKMDEALPALQQALALAPEDIEVYHNLGETLLAKGRVTEARDIYRKSLKHNPTVAESYYSLANTLIELGEREEAETNYSKALELNPDYAEAYYNLGNLLREQNRLAESQAQYQKAIKLKQDYYKAYSNLGIVLQMQGQLKEAENCYRKSLEIHPNYVEGHINLGACLKEQGLYHKAENSYKDALAIHPDFALCYSNLGSVLKEQGRLDEAEKALRRAIELKPDYTEAYNNLLFLLNYHPDKSSEEIYTEYRNFNTLFGAPLQSVLPPYNNSCQTNRRLKIGYVSPQFRLHSTRHFLEPLLAHHDKQHVEIFAYAEVSSEDAITERYRSYVDHWITTTGLSDATLAEQIRADGIDILVDLAGHTAHNRLRVFTLKPAPISLHWLDFGYTTGLTSIDYYLTDRATVPAGSEGLFSETPWLLETPSFAYRPAEGMGNVSPLPAATRGYITFGTLTRAVRINHRTIRVWTEILKNVEGSHLVIDSSNFRDTAMQEEMADKFLAHGIDRERLEIGYHSPPWDVLRAMDISLDCFPHNSGTTLFETLYMGVPFVTLADRPSVGRLGSSILEGVGHPEWIARTEKEYVELAVGLATDLHNLVNLRTTLRQDMENSPLMDEPAFARKMETAYQKMFVKWCKGEQPLPSPIKDKEATSASPQNILHEAENHYQAGQFQEAENLYLSILETDPQHPEANYRMGCLTLALQQPSAALPYFEAALDVCPEHGPYWLAYIDALNKAGKSESAVQILEMAIQSGLDGEEVETLKKRLATVPTGTPLDTAKNPKPTQTTKKKEQNRQRKDAIPHPNETNGLVSLFQQGNFVEAKSVANSLIERFPQNSLAWQVLGAIHRQQGSLAEALSAMEMAVEFKPNDYVCLRNIAVLLCDLGRYAEAEDYCHRALALRSDYADGYNTLSIALNSQKKLSEAERSCRKALELKPDVAETFVTLGLILNEEKKFSEAEFCNLKALELNPDFAEAYCGLCITLQAAGRVAEAEAACRQALILKPDFVAAYNSLGGILNEQGRYDEAETAYRQALEFRPLYLEALYNLGKTLHNQNRYAEAESCFTQVLEIDPRNTDAYYNLANTLAEQGHHKEAEINYQAALKIRPDYPEVYLNLGNTLRVQGWITKAERIYRKAIQLHPDYKKAQNNLGCILQEMGRLSESESIFRSTLESNPNYADTFGNLLFLLNYHPDKSSEEIFQEYVVFEERFGRPLRAEWKPHVNSKKKNRRLKIGYVSPQFCQHPISNFLEPLLACHNKDLVELYGYAELNNEDSVTERYRSYMDHWIPTRAMTDAAMAERIRADGIDILVDLAGHTEHNRLLVFARKPTPVSLHWLDFGYTTGLAAIDYYLTDDASVPTGSEELFSETPWKIETPCFTYRPKEGMGEVNPLPAIQRGYITFGCLSRAVRINHRTIRVWAEILKRVEGSHLVINSCNFKDPEMQKVLAENFFSHGIERERLEIGYNSPPWDVLRSLDIGFDCFPHNSGTTLIESLYMGVPFVTLASRPSVGRLGCSLLEGLGHPELIARSEEEYIELAVALTADLPRLAKFRAGLRQEMKRSPLMNEPAFARKVEAAYKDMFKKWCEEQQ